MQGDWRRSWWRCGGGGASAGADPERGPRTGSRARARRRQRVSHPRPRTPSGPRARHPTLRHPARPRAAEQVVGGGGFRAVISALPRAGGDLGSLWSDKSAFQGAAATRRCACAGGLRPARGAMACLPPCFWLPNRETCHSVVCGKLQRVAGRTSCLASAVQSGPLLAGSSQAKHRRGFLGNSFAVKAHSERENTLSASAGQLSPALDAAAIQQSVTQIVSKFERL